VVHVHVLDKTFHLSDLLSEHSFTHLFVHALGVAGDPCDEDMAESFILSALDGNAARITLLPFS